MNILITGSSSGIGSYLSTYYNPSVYNPVNTVYKFSRSNGWDVRNPDDVREFVSDLGKLDVLINCAGVASMNSFLLMPEETAHNLMTTNFLGTFNMCQGCAPLLRKSDCPRIINFTSVAVPLALEGEAVYAASKAAVETFTKVIAKELAPWGITVNAIGPAPTKTQLIDKVPQDKIDLLIQKQGVKRMGRMEDISSVTDWLISQRSDFVTGQIIYLGGV